VPSIQVESVQVRLTPVEVQTFDVTVAAPNPVVQVVSEGPQGPSGPQGIQGVPGEKGDTGPAGVVQADAPITYDANSQTVGSDGSLLVTVEHGGDDSEPRPSYAATVYWKGTVAPVNGANGDLWYDSSGDV
jgi:hypothetical protein